MLYKIRHKSSGLYYKPSKDTGINLSKKGKVYTKKPSLKAFRGSQVVLGFVVPGRAKKLGDDDNTVIEGIVNEFDWELVGYEVNEIPVSWGEVK